MTFEQGEKDCVAFHTSKQYAHFVKPIAALDAMKLFIPNSKEMLTPMSSPLPKKKQDWLNGWNNKLGELDNVETN